MKSVGCLWLTVVLATKLVARLQEGFFPIDFYRLLQTSYRHRISKEAPPIQGFTDIQTLQTYFEALIMREK